MYIYICIYIYVIYIYFLVFRRIQRGYLLVKTIELPTHFSRRLLQASILCGIKITYKKIILT